MKFGIKKNIEVYGKKIRFNQHICNSKEEKMKVDIKSFLIGILTTVNLFLLMGFDDYENESQNGRYQVIIDSKGDQYWYDTRYGDKIAIGSKSYGYIFLKEKGGMKERFDKEFQLVEALKKLD